MQGGQNGRLREGAKRWDTFWRQKLGNGGEVGQPAGGGGGQGGQFDFHHFGRNRDGQSAQGMGAGDQRRGPIVHSPGAPDVPGPVDAGQPGGGASQYNDLWRQNISHGGGFGQPDGGGGGASQWNDLWRQNLPQDGGSGQPDDQKRQRWLNALSGGQNMQHRWKGY